MNLSSEPQNIPPQPVRRRFNEMSVLFPLLSLYTIAYLGIMLAEFLTRGSFPAPDGMMPIYIALLGAYAADKEIRRWAGKPEPPRKGTLFVYIWMLFYLFAYLLRAWRPEFAVSDELPKVVLQVLGIFFGSRASKYVHNTRSGNATEIASQREQQILALIKEQGKVKTSDVAKKLDISATSAKRVLNDMLVNGLIIRKGEGKQSVYQMPGGT